MDRQVRKLTFQKSWNIIYWCIVAFIPFVRKYIENHCKNVGENFSREARSIHYEKKTSQGIYGKATPEETSELIEEGIEVVTMPWVDKSEN